MSGKRVSNNVIVKHFASLGFTNRMALYIIGLLSVGLACGFYLAIQSIITGYTGALYCFTIVFTPIGTGCTLVLGKISDKNKEENTGATETSGEGIKYMLANKATTTVDGSDNSPAI